jgi:hypothetical protein
MADFVLTVGAGALCPHGAPLQIVPSQVKVLFGGQPAATTADTFLVTGCPFTVPSGKPQPCVTARFAPALKLLLRGTPAVLRSSTSICQSPEQIPQGPAVVTATQVRVMAT